MFSIHWCHNRGSKAGGFRCRANLPTDPDFEGDVTGNTEFF